MLASSSTPTAISVWEKWYLSIQFWIPGISADGEELSVGELKVQLEVSEGETGLLRKKVDNLLTENLKLTKEIREINVKLSDEKKKKPSATTTSYGKNDKNSNYEQKIDELQTDLNSTRYV